MDIFIKGQRSNFSEIEHIGPYHSIHEEPSLEELRIGELESKKIKNIILLNEKFEIF